MPGINDLKEERFILAHGFRRACGAEKFTSWWPGSRERGYRKGAG
jgi:hypothetical protein